MPVSSGTDGTDRERPHVGPPNSTDDRSPRPNAPGRRTTVDRDGVMVARSMAGIGESAALIARGTTMACTTSVSSAPTDSWRRRLGPRGTNPAGGASGLNHVDDGHDGRFPGVEVQLLHDGHEALLAELVHGLLRLPDLVDGELRAFGETGVVQHPDRRPGTVGLDLLPDVVVGGLVHRRGAEVDTD